MTDPNYTHLAILLDRSGSMSTIAADTCGGFDAFIAEQRQHPGKCTVSLAQFDDRYEVVYDLIDLAEVPPLSLEPRGWTALLDALGRFINETGRTLSEMEEADRPGTVMIVVMTDGEENSSTEMTLPTIRNMIRHQEQIYSWTFTYLGANQDAIKVGAELGVSQDRSFTYSGSRSAQALSAVSASVGRMRAARQAGESAESAREHGSFTEAERASGLE